MIVSYEQVMLMGDFNGTVDNKLDRKGKKKKNNEGKLPKTFFELVKQENLENIWRKWNSNVKDFTFYLTRQDSLSRTDMLWTTKNIGLMTSGNNAKNQFRP